MSRTDIDAITIANALRRMAGDGSIEWVMEPIQASVLLNVANLLDENAKLRERVDELEGLTDGKRYIPQEWYQLATAENAKLRELVRIAGTYCVNGLCGKDDGCPLYLGKPYCALHDRMRELGIEVD